MHLPARFAAIILTFAPVFLQPRTWRHAELLLIGAILAPGKRTVTSLLRIAGLSRERRFTNYHRILNRVSWEARTAARLLLSLLVAAFAPAGPVVLGIDDTIERRRGKRISAKGIYRDPVRSSKGHFVKASGLPLRSRLCGCDAFCTGSTALPLMAEPHAPGSAPLGGSSLGLAVPDRARTLGALLPRARPAAQKADRLGTADGRTSAAMVAWARGRAAGRQQLRRPGPSGGSRPPWAGLRHRPPTAGRGPVPAGAAAPAGNGRAAAEQGHTPAEPCRPPGDWGYVLGCESPCQAGTARASGPSRSAPRPRSGVMPVCRSCQSAFAGASASDPCGTGSMPLASMGAAARLRSKLRATGPALHRSRSRSAADRALVRPTLAGGSHLPGGARPSRRRDPTPVVGPGDRAHHAVPARAVLDRDPARCAP